MPHQLILHDSDLEITITFDDGAQPYPAPLIRAFDKLVRAWFDESGIAKLAFGPAGVDGVFPYIFEHEDGRVWVQTIDFSVDPDDPTMTFDVTDKWKLSEFRLTREARRNIITLHNQFLVSEVLVERAPV